jgi:hypothetical protein
MARQEINIGVSANDGNGDPLRTAFSKINSMTTELYLDDAGDVNSITATAPIARDSATGAVTISLSDGGISTQKIADDAVTTDKLANAINSAITANTAKVTNATHTGEVTGSAGSAALTIANDVISYAKLGAEFTTTDQVTTELDFGGHQVFTKTMTAGTTFTYANVEIGMVKDFILNGNYTPTFPNGTKTIAGTYSGSATANFIQIVAQASGNYWMSISQAQ